MIRKAAVAGRFYSGSKEQLEEEIRKCFAHEIGPGLMPGPVLESAASPFGLISPHAGYIFSGPVAATGFAALAEKGKPERVIILGPNHTGYGRGVSVWPQGVWRTPLGSVSVDGKFVEELKEHFGDSLSKDTTAHIFEHSIEVQLPFLQMIYGDDFLLVPIIMADQSLSTVRGLAETLKTMLVESDPTFLIASSDLNHYDSHDVTSRKDRQLISAIEERNDELVYTVAQSERVSACGIGPICVLLNSFSEIRSLRHATSGDISGDRAHTVGYYSALLSSY